VKNRDWEIGQISQEGVVLQVASDQRIDSGRHGHFYEG
jgi:hypothetical protein